MSGAAVAAGGADCSAAAGEGLAVAAVWAEADVSAVGAVVAAALFPVLSEELQAVSPSALASIMIPAIFLNVVAMLSSPWLV
ncbi:hypothetical protein D3C76_1626400 [compost metagenome]